MVSTPVAADPAAVAPIADPAAPVVADPSQGQAPVVSEGTAGDAAPGTPVEAPKPLSVADLSDDDLLALLRERKNGEGFSLEDRIRKSGVDRYVADWQRKQGQSEIVQKRVGRILEQHGIDPSELGQGEAGELLSLYGLAAQDALGNIGRAWVKATADEFSVSDRTLLDDALLRFTEDPTGIDDLASKMLIAVRDTVRGKTLAESSLTDIPEGSKLRADLMVEAHRLADVELKARATAAGRVDSPPVAPRGGPVGSRTEQYRSMTAQQAARLPAPEYAEWQRVVAAGVA